MDDFQAHTKINWHGDVGTVQYGGGDAGQVVMFYLRPVHNPAKSSEAGTPQYEDKIFVRIHPPGERLNIVEREVRDSDKKRWPQQWAQFKDNQPQAQTGTPIDMLFPAEPSVSAALKAGGVFTIEQCANMSASAIDSFMGGQKWANEAKRWLDVANKGVKASQLKAALDEKDREIHTLKNTVDMLKNQLDELASRTTQSVTLEDVQRMIANQGAPGNRAVYPPGGVGKNKAFDAQVHQINGTHKTADLSNQKIKSRTRVRVS